MAKVNQLSKSGCCFTTLPFTMKESLNYATNALDDLPFSDRANDLYCSYENLKIVQAVCTWFESWQPWQHRILFAGLVNRLSKPQVRSLKTVVESVFHRDFIANCKDVYPMKKAKRKETTVFSSSITGKVLSDDLQQKYPNTAVKKDSSLSKDDELSQKFFKEDIHLILKKQQRLCPSLLAGGISHVLQDDKTCSENFNQSSSIEPLHIIDTDQCSHQDLPLTSHSKDRSDEQQRNQQQKTNSTSFVVSKTKHTVESLSDSQHSSKLNATLRNIVDSESSLPHKNVEETNSSAEQSHMSSHISPLIDLKKDIHKQQRSSRFQSRDLNEAQTRKSTSSPWTMGPTDSYCDESKSDFGSRITALHLSSKDFFPLNVTAARVKRATSVTKVGSDFVNRLDNKRNKAPYPTATQLYKNAKFWSSRHVAVNAKTPKLKENFRLQLDQIWAWVEMQEGHLRIRLLIELLDRTEPKEVKYLADCIKHKLTEGCLEEITTHLLPDNFWLQIFSYLEPDDLLKVSSVCKRWFSLINGDALWIMKCKTIGEKFGIDDLTKVIQNAAAKNETLDWKQAYIELQQHLDISLKRLASKQQEEEVETSSDDALGEDSSSDEEESFKHLAEKYKGYKDFQSRFNLDDTVDAAQLNSVEEPEAIADTTSKQTLQVQRKSGKKVKESFVGASGAQQSRGDDEEEQRNQVGVEQKSAPGAGGFLEMWKNIKQDLKSVDAESVSRRSDWCYNVEVRQQLYSDKEMEKMNKKGKAFAVDYRIPRGSLVLVNNMMLPVRKVQVLEICAKQTDGWFNKPHAFQQPTTPPRSPGHRGAVNCILLQGLRIFSGGADRRVRLWTDSGETFAKMEDVLKGSVLSMAIGADDKCRTLYTASWDTSVSVWDCVTYKRRRALDGHTDTVSGVAVDGKFIISCSYDGTVRVWDIRNFHCQKILHNHTGAILCLAYKDRLIITGGVDKLVHVADANSGRQLKKYQGHEAPVTAVQRQRRLVASGDRIGIIMFWSLDDGGAPLETLKAHSQQINQITFHGGRFFTASDDRLVKEWELVTMTCCRVLQGHRDAVLDVKYCDKYLISCSKDGTIRLWWWGFQF